MRPDPPARAHRALAACWPGVAATVLVMTLAGCSALNPQARTDAALQLAADAGWQGTHLTAGRFDLLALHPPSIRATSPVPTLAVFIEGDGLAWLDPHTPSDDPTPRHPIALQMALAEPHLPSVYLARPCQYNAALTATNCSEQDWTGGRFSAEIVDAMDDAVSQLKARSGAQQLVFVGYSGGGAIATLLAARRTDVARLVTVAAVLDTSAWASQHRITPLEASLNPADQWQALRGVPQVHFVGQQDRQTGRAAVQSFVDRFGHDSHTLQPVVIEIEGADHHCCWAKDWARLSPLAGRGLDIGLDLGLDMGLPLPADTPAPVPFGLSLSKPLLVQAQR
ncbi:MAG: alpha/beta fold hydrolase [Polaromonas sp.]|nr:alpha/beta fold hydrolase [Polaromonas sp.]